MSVLSMPEEAVSRRLTVYDAEFRGIIVPIGEGSIAIVGQPGEALDGIERRLRLGVRLASCGRPEPLVRDRAGRYA